MRAFLLLLVLGACAPIVPAATDTAAAQASEDATAELAVIGDGDGAVVLISVVDRKPVALDTGKPAHLMIGGAMTEAVMLDAPSMRQRGDRIATGASYRVSAKAAQELARGSSVAVELSIAGVYRHFQASRADLFQ